MKTGFFPLGIKTETKHNIFWEKNLDEKKEA